MTHFEQLLSCYRSGQMSERQWQEHLRDELFAAWCKRETGAAGEGRI